MSKPFFALALVTLLAATAVSESASAQTTQWTGVTSANWNDGGNWSAGIPGATNTVLFSTGSGSAANLSTNNDIPGGASILGISNTLAPAGPVSISGNAITLGSGGIAYGQGANAATQNLSVNTDLTLAASQDWTMGGVGRTLTVGATSANTVALNGNTITLRHVGNVEFLIINSSIVNGTSAGALAFLASSGTSKTQFRLLGTNTYTGGTTSTGANQVIQLGSSSAAGSGPLGTGTITLAGVSTYLEAYGADRTLDNNFTISGGNTLVATTTIGQTNRSLTLNGTISSLTGNRTILTDSQASSGGSGDLIFNGNILLGTSGQAGGTLNTGQTATPTSQPGRVIYNGNLLETSGVTSGVILSVLNGSGAFQTKVQLNGQNTHSGGTTVGAAQGIVEIGSSSTVVAGNIVSGPLGTGALTFNNGGNTPRIEAVGGARTVANNVTMTSAGIVQGSQDLTLTGNMSGVGNLTKNGAGVLTLTGTNTGRSGATTINAGTLLVNNTAGSGTGTGAVTVNATGTLGGTGTLDLTGVQLTFTGGTLAPGNTPGTLHLLGGGAVVFDANAILNYELNGGNTAVDTGVNDLLTGAGALTLNGTLNVTDTNPGSFATATAGATWRLINYSGNLTDNGLSLGAMPALGGGLAFGLDVGTLGQVNLVVNAAIPEASAFLFGGLVCGAFGVRFAAAKRRGKLALN